MISNCPFLPCRSVPILAVTVDLPTILALKASFESGRLEQVTITYNTAVGKKQVKVKKISTDAIIEIKSNPQLKCSEKDFSEHRIYIYILKDLQI